MVNCLFQTFSSLNFADIYSCSNFSTAQIDNGAKVSLHWNQADLHSQWRLTAFQFCSGKLQIRLLLLHSFRYKNQIPACISLSFHRLDKFRAPVILPHTCNFINPFREWTKIESCKFSSISKRFRIVLLTCPFYSIGPSYDTNVYITADGDIPSLQPLVPGPNGDYFTQAWLIAV